MKDAKGGEGDDHFSIVSGSLKGFFFDEDKEQLRIDEGQAEGIKGGERKETFSLASIEIKKLDIDVEDHVVCRYLKAADFKFVEMGKQGPRNGVDIFSLVVAGVDFAKLDDPKSYGIGKIELLKLGVLGGRQPVGFRAARRHHHQQEQHPSPRCCWWSKPSPSTPRACPPRPPDSSSRSATTRRSSICASRVPWTTPSSSWTSAPFSITSAQLGDLSYAIKMGGIQVDPKNPMMSAMKMQGDRLAHRRQGGLRGPGPGAGHDRDGGQAEQAAAGPVQGNAPSPRRGGNPKQPKGPAFQALVEEVVKFIQSPGELHISVHPDKPVKMDDLQKLNEEQVIQVLKVKITTKPAAKM